MWSNWKFETINDVQYLISPNGRKYTERDVELERYNQVDLARALNVTKAAIADRLRRGTLPPFDDDKKWHVDTIKHLFPLN